MNGVAVHLRTVLALCLCALALLALGHRTQTRWSIDGYTYAVMAQMDTGTPFAAARHTAQDFYLKTETGQRALARRQLARDEPLWWGVFSLRPAYPALAALLWRFYGFNSLLLVSGIAYVTVVLLTYVLALRFANPWAAAVAAGVVAVTPAVRVLARDALTDETAIACWLATLIAACAYVQRPRPAALLLFALAAFGLVLTRPVPYAPACCAAALAFIQPRRAVLPGAVAIATAIVPLSIALHNHVHFPVYQPYLPALINALAACVMQLIAAAWPLAGLAGLFAIRRHGERAILTGAAIAPIVSIAINPVPTDVARIALAPLIPVAACGIAALLSRAYERTRVAQVTAS